MVLCALKCGGWVEVSVVSGWKVRRELGRLGQQLRGLAELITDPIAQRRLEATVAAGLPLLQGDLPAGRSVAIYLVFQPAGLAESTLQTCRWLAQAGYAPVVVSNTPLSRQDRDRLRPVVWRALERPNFGYDFGGYRDGLTSLAQWGTDPDEVLILNDSVWAPVLPQTDLMQRLRDEPAEVAGTIMRHRGAERFLESYLYRLRRPALEHSAFKNFWTKLRLTSNKYHVIRRGERGFSAALRAGGLRVAAIYNTDDLVGQLATQEDDVLTLTLRHAAYVDSDLAAERDRLLGNRMAQWRSDTLAHIARVSAKRPFYSSFPYAMVRLSGYPLLKKSTEPISRAWRLAHMAAVDAGDLPPPPSATLAEIRQKDAEK